MEAALAGATVVGVAGLIKDKAAVSSKLAATKVNVSATAKAKFSQKQQLRAESSRRISSIAEGKVAKSSTVVHEVELAGTGMKMKVPVNEPHVSAVLASTESKTASTVSKAIDRPKTAAAEMGSIAEIAKHEAVTRKIDQAKSVGQKKLTPQELGTEASTLDKVPYSSKTMESMLRVNNPGVEIISTTLAKESHPNTSLAGGSIERKVMIRPEAGEFITQRIIFNERGFPIFDKYVKCETRISADLKSMSREAHMRAATRQLRADIEAGIVPKNMFNEGQLSDITKGIEKIRGFTWHHHEDVGRMQLVPEDIHEFVKHVGGFEMWGGEK